MNKDHLQKLIAKREDLCRELDVTNVLIDRYGRLYKELLEAEKDLLSRDMKKTEEYLKSLRLEIGEV